MGVHRLPKLVVGCLCLSGWLGVNGQDTVTMEEVTVTSSRYPDPLSPPTGFSTITADHEELTAVPQNQLDDVLRTLVPGFSLFRRSSSETANPTTQGASLRNIGPNGAGRTLVLLDGVPQNDPFGGWVYWNRLPPALLGQATIVQGGGAGVFGNNALGGTIYLSRHQPESISASLTLGDQDMADGTLMFNQSAGNFRVFGTAHGQTTSGYPVVREDQRGPVDINADSRSVLFEGGFATRLESGIEVSLTATWFEEERGNGTPLTNNRTEAFDLSLQIKGPAAGDVQWESLLFFQDRTFESTFSSVNEERSAETPSLDQYHVPAHSVGYSFTTTIAGGLLLPHAERERSKLLLGFDARWIEGETNELFRYDGTRFLNNREAGGEQWLAGVFAEQTWGMSEDLSITLGGRADYWNLRDGRRVEKSISSGVSLLDEEYASRDGIAVNGRLGVNLKLNNDWQWRSAAYTGFRVPTLNELYRPFRVRNDITGANDALEPEQLVGVETGFDWNPAESLKLGATFFWNRLHDAVANVTVLQGPGVAPDGTVIPEGGVYRQRQNIDAVTTAGVEVSVQWRPVEQTTFSIGYLYTHTDVSAASPLLDGRELAQAPAHVLSGAFSWQPHTQWQFLFQARYGGRQFEDDLNSLELDSYIVCDAALNWQVKPQFSVGLVVENLFDETVETGRSGDGLVSIGAPRWAGIRMTWKL